MSTETNPPEDFEKIINDFINDIKTTFPEHNAYISKWWDRKFDVNKTTAEENKKREVLFVYRHCMKHIPERFFDILYQNDEIFSIESTTDTEFLPGLLFKNLWACDISDNTKETIWTYLKLILFSLLGQIENNAAFGESSKLFEAIDDNELQNKLQETIENMQNMFAESKESDVSSEGASSDNSTNTNLPNAEDLHSRISSMMNGKLGKLAIELAEETAQDLNLNMETPTNTSEMFQQLYKNPMKLMNMVKNIGSKLDSKIKSGEIKESELMKEGMDILQQMKDIPGFGGDMQKMISQMGLGKGAKVNLGAMEAQMNRAMKTEKMKERMREKAANKKNKGKENVASNI